MKSVIYLIICTKCPRKYYVGSALIFLRRQNKHLKDLKKNKHHCKYLQRIYNKYGKEILKFYILEEVKDLSKLLDREDYYLQDYFDFDDELYNECFVAGSTFGISFKGHIAWNKGKKLPDFTIEHKRKLSLSHIGNTPWNKGKKCPLLEETKIKISKANMGKPSPFKGKRRPEFTKEHRRKLSIALMGNINGKKRIYE